MKKKGFTLVELMLVIAIIAILAAILTPNLVRARNQGNVTACKNNLKSLGTAIEMYSNDNTGSYPSSLPLLTTTYVQSLPTCPLRQGTSYSYGYATTSYSVYCSGTLHTGVGGCTAANLPQYDSTQGLLPK